MSSLWVDGGRAHCEELVSRYRRPRKAQRAFNERPRTRSRRRPRSTCLTAPLCDCSVASIFISSPISPPPPPCIAGRATGGPHQIAPSAHLARNARQRRREARASVGTLRARRGAVVGRRVLNRGGEAAERRARRRQRVAEQRGGERGGGGLAVGGVDEHRVAERARRRAGGGDGADESINGGVEGRGGRVAEEEERGEAEEVGRALLQEGRRQLLAPRAHQVGEEPDDVKTVGAGAARVGGGGRAHHEREGRDVLRAPAQRARQVLRAARRPPPPRRAPAASAARAPPPRRSRRQAAVLSSSCAASSVRSCSPRSSLHSLAAAAAASSSAAVSPPRKAANGSAGALPPPPASAAASAASSVAVSSRRGARAAAHASRPAALISRLRERSSWSSAARPLGPDRGAERLRRRVRQQIVGEVERGDRRRLRRQRVEQLPRLLVADRAARERGHSASASPDCNEASASAKSLAASALAEVAVEAPPPSAALRAAAAFFLARFLAAADCSPSGAASSPAGDRGLSNICRRVRDGLRLARRLLGQRVGCAPSSPLRRPSCVPSSWRRRTARPARPRRRPSRSRRQPQSLVLRCATRARRVEGAPERCVASRRRSINAVDGISPLIAGLRRADCVATHLRLLLLKLSAAVSRRAAQCNAQPDCDWCRKGPPRLRLLHARPQPWSRVHQEVAGAARPAAARPLRLRVARPECAHRAVTRILGLPSTPRRRLRDRRRRSSAAALPPLVRPRQQRRAAARAPNSRRPLQDGRPLPGEGQARRAQPARRQAARRVER